MKLNLPEETSARYQDGNTYHIYDDTGELVGSLRARPMYDNRGFRRSIELYGKYSGEFQTHDECIAFARGVEAVLNHMVKVERD